MLKFKLFIYTEDFIRNILTNENLVIIIMKKGTIIILKKLWTMALSKLSLTNNY